MKAKTEQAIREEIRDVFTIWLSFHEEGVISLGEFKLAYLSYVDGGLCFHEEEQTPYPWVEERMEKVRQIEDLQATLKAVHESGAMTKEDFKTAMQQALVAHGFIDAASVPKKEGN